MSDAVLGEIRMFAGTYAPMHWMLCDGQLLAITSYNALYTAIGTTYGGDGRTTFQLPDMRGRLPMSAGSGPGLTPRSAGQKFGTEKVVLNQSDIPSHSHSFNASSDAANTSSPINAVMAAQNDGDEIYTSDASALKSLNINLIGTSGGQQGHSNIMPYTCLNFIICTKV